MRWLKFAVGWLLAILLGIGFWSWVGIATALALLRRAMSKRSRKS